MKLKLYYLLVIVLPFNILTRELKKEKLIGHRFGKFEISPYPDKVREILPNDRFEVVDCYIIINNKTSKILKVNFFYRKDRLDKPSDIIPLPTEKNYQNLINSNRITGFVVPKIKWLEKINVESSIHDIVNKFDIIKNAPVVGFSISLINEDSPFMPEFLLPKDRPTNATFSYNIVPITKKPGFEVHQILNLTS